MSAAACLTDCSTDCAADCVASRVATARALYRDYCCAPVCAWTGSLEHRVGGRKLYGASGSRRHVLDAARMSGLKT